MDGNTCLKKRQKNLKTSKSFIEVYVKAIFMVMFVFFCKTLFEHLCLRAGRGKRLRSQKVRLFFGGQKRFAEPFSHSSLSKSDHLRSFIPAPARLPTGPTRQPTSPLPRASVAASLKHRLSPIPTVLLSPVADSDRPAPPVADSDHPTPPVADSDRPASKLDIVLIWSSNLI
ncbi:hypothetical protein LXL04_032753 [Taraxacum kok-saghyz]